MDIRGGTSAILAQRTEYFHRYDFSSMIIEVKLQLYEKFE
jgi:hypothetical protein